MSSRRRERASLKTMPVLVALVCLTLLLAACQDLDATDTTAVTTTSITTTTEVTDAATDPTEVTESTPSAPGTPEPEPPEPATDTTEEALSLTFYDDSPRILWDGSWEVSSNANDAGGSSRYTSTSGYLSLDFYGAGIRLVCRTGPKMAKARVILTGPESRSDVLVSLYSASVQYQQEVWSVGFLPVGHYNLQVRYEEPFGTAATLTPTKPRSIFVDGFWITGNIE